MKTAKEYLDQFPNAIPEKTVDWLAFATEYAQYRVNEISSNAVLKATSDPKENKKESEAALPNCEYCTMEGDKHNEDCPDYYIDE